MFPLNQFWNDSPRLGFHSQTVPFPQLFLSTNLMSTTSLFVSSGASGFPTPPLPPKRVTCVVGKAPSPKAKEASLSVDTPHPTTRILITRQVSNARFSRNPSMYDDCQHVICPAYCAKKSSSYFQATKRPIKPKNGLSIMVLASHFLIVFFGDVLQSFLPEASRASVTNLSHRSAVQRQL